ncbi:MAG: hypothetical protein R2911_25470 [Caldilineaceae bacterium]
MWRWPRRLIFNGLGLEPWLDDLYSASGATTQRIVVSDGRAVELA